MLILKAKSPGCSTNLQKSLCLDFVTQRTKISPYMLSLLSGEKHNLDFPIPFTKKFKVQPFSGSAIFRLIWNIYARPCPKRLNSHQSLERKDWKGNLFLVTLFPIIMEVVEPHTKSLVQSSYTAKWCPIHPNCTWIYSWWLNQTFLKIWFMIVKMGIFPKEGWI